MKWTFSLFLLTAILATGCKSNYDITLSNGAKITGISKPKLDKKTDRYVYKDAAGVEKSVPAMRVREIQPHEEGNSQFRSTQTRGPR